MDTLKDRFDKMINSLPSEFEREFETDIADFVTGTKEPELAHLKEFLQDQLYKQEEDRAYIAFLSLATLHRRNEENIDLRYLFKEHGSMFKNRILYYHFKALMYKSAGELRNGLEASKTALETFPDLYKQSGIVHGYGETAIQILEEDKTLNEEETKEFLEIARKHVTKAVHLSERNYAKYLATYAKILIFEEDYENARKYLKTAIDKEKSGNDYQLRVAKYYQLLSNIQVTEKVKENKKDQEYFHKEMNEKVKKFSEQMEESFQKQREEFTENKAENAEMIDEMKRQYLQMLGFFTAIISFTIGSIQVINSQSFEGAVLLMLVLAGVLLIAYAGFSFTIFASMSRNYIFSNVFIMILGVLIISISIFIYKNGWIGGAI